MSILNGHKSQTKAPASARKTALWKRPCPECAAELEATLMPADGLPGVCPECAAIFITVAAKPPRMPKTQEWHDFCCLPGFNYIWDVRQGVMERLTAPPKGAKHLAEPIPR